MAPIPALFTIPIAGSKGSSSITATQPASHVYLLTFNHAPDNRMTVGFCNAFTLALDVLEHRFPKGVVVTTSAIDKFYSNGLDFESAVKSNGFFEKTLYPLWRRLLTYVFVAICLGFERCAAWHCRLSQWGIRVPLSCAPSGVGAKYGSFNCSTHASLVLGLIFGSLGY